MKCEIHKLKTLKNYKYVVTFARYHNKWVFCKHKQRDTWEVPGGHIEQGELPIAAARRELYEESGAVEADITAVCDYWAGDDSSGASGVVYFADILELGELPDSEMEKVLLSDELPAKLTYPDIYPKLLSYIKEKVNLQNRVF